MTALSRYNANMEGEVEPDPIERLRLFLSLAITGQDWLDVEQFIDGVSNQLAIRDAEIARLKTIPMRYRRVAFNAQLQDEVTMLEQENDQLHTQIKQKDAEIADLLEANRIACEDIVEQQNLRVKYAGQIEELVAALEGYLDAINASARAEMDYANARENFTDSIDEGKAARAALVAASKAEGVARATLAKVRKP